MVDDFELTLVVLLDALRQAGYDADGVPSSIAARDAIRKGAYKVIVSDYQMFGGTGLDLLALVKYVSPETPVILYSGSLDEERLEVALGRGAFAVLKKPFPIGALLDRIKDAVAARPGGPKPSDAGGSS